MTTIAKNGISYRKLDRATDRTVVTGFEPVVFAHQFALSGQTEIDLTALSAPAVMTAAGFTNPSVAQLLNSHLYAYRTRLSLTSSVQGKLMDYVSYNVATNSKITLTNSSSAGEIVTGVITPVPVEGVSIADGKSIVQTGTVGVGYTDFIVNEYFTVNKYSDQQVGDVMVLKNGVLQLRNPGNAVSGADYYEVPPGAGSLSNTIRFTSAVSGAPAKVVVLSNGLVAERPQEGALAKIETMAAQIDLLVPDVAVLKGRPVGYYQSAPNNVDTKVFGEKVNRILFGMLADFIVGPSDYVSGGYASHTTLQSAVDAASDGSKIFIHKGTYPGNVTINKKLYIEGNGHNSYLSGSVSFGGSSDFSLMKDLRFGNLSLDSGADGIFVRECWQTAGSTVSNLGSGNSLMIIKE